MRLKFLLLAAALLTLPLTACGARSASDQDAAPAAAGTVTSVSGTSLPMSPADAASSASPSASGGEQPAAGSSAGVSETDAKLLKAAKEVVEALRDRDLKRLSRWIDPDLGLRFSPYPHLNVQTDQVLKAGELPAFHDKTIRTWGTFDGSGAPIQLTFRDYFEQFVYDHDFASAPNVSVNKLVGTGNIPFNGTEVYPKASYVEYHYPGFDPGADGQDWESLILMFVPADDGWRLCAIVHSQRTI